MLLVELLEVEVWPKWRLCNSDKSHAYNLKKRRRTGALRSLYHRERREVLSLALHQRVRSKHTISCHQVPQELC